MTGTELAVSLTGTVRPQHRCKEQDEGDMDSILKKRSLNAVDHQLTSRNMHRMLKDISANGAVPYLAALVDGSWFGSLALRIKQRS